MKGKLYSFDLGALPRMPRTKGSGRVPLRSEEVGRVIGDLLGLLQQADKREPKCHPFHVWQHHFSKGLSLMRAYFDVGDQGKFHVVGPQVILEGTGGVYAICGKLITLNTHPPESGTQYEQHFEILLPRNAWARCLSLEHDVCHLCSSELTRAVGVMSYPGHIDDAARATEYERKRVLTSGQYERWIELESAERERPGAIDAEEAEGDAADDEPEADEPDEAGPRTDCVHCGKEVENPSVRVCDPPCEEALTYWETKQPGAPGGSRSELDA